MKSMREAKKSKESVEGLYKNTTYRIESHLMLKCSKYLKNKKSGRETFADFFIKALDTKTENNDEIDTIENKRVRLVSRWICIPKELNKKIKIMSVIHEMSVLELVDCALREELRRRDVPNV